MIAPESTSTVSLADPGTPPSGLVPGAQCPVPASAFTTLLDPSLSLPEVAQRHSISLPDLARWITHSETAATLALIREAIADRDQTLLTNQRSTAINAVTQIMRRGIAEPTTTSADTTCRAVALFLRLASALTEPRAQARGASPAFPRHSQSVDDLSHISRGGAGETSPALVNAGVSAGETSPALVNKGASAGETSPALVNEEASAGETPHALVNEGVSAAETPPTLALATTEPLDDPDNQNDPDELNDMYEFDLAELQRKLESLVATRTGPPIPVPRSAAALIPPHILQHFTFTDDTS